MGSIITWDRPGGNPKEPAGSLPERSVGSPSPRFLVLMTSTPPCPRCPFVGLPLYFCLPRLYYRVKVCSNVLEVTGSRLLGNSGLGSVSGFPVEPRDEAPLRPPGWRLEGRDKRVRDLRGGASVVPCPSDPCRPTAPGHYLLLSFFSGQHLGLSPPAP